MWSFLVLLWGCRNAMSLYFWIWVGNTSAVLSFRLISTHLWYKTYHMQIHHDNFLPWRFDNKTQTTVTRPLVQVRVCCSHLVTNTTQTPRMHCSMVPARPCWGRSDTWSSLWSGNSSAPVEEFVFSVETNRFIQGSSENLKSICHIQSS